MMRNPKTRSTVDNFRQQVLLWTFRLLILMVFSQPVAEGLMCFQCGTTAPGPHPCVDDYLGFVNTSKGEIDLYAKNCSEPPGKWTRCMIQWVEVGGKRILFHRGCHNGKTFAPVESSRFENLSSNNDTTCAQPVDKLACYQFCDQDYCNGPQIPPEETDEDADCVVRNRTNYGEDLHFCGAESLRWNYSFLFVLLHLLLVLSLTGYAGLLG